jgi:hypothetical protein
MRSINEVLAPQKFKSDFQVKREKQLLAVKKNSSSVNQKNNCIKQARINTGLRLPDGIKRPFMDYNAPAPPSSY